MATTDTTSLATAIPTEIIDPLVLAYLRNAVVITPLVRQVNIAGIPGLKYDFQSYGSSSFGSKTQGIDLTPAALSTSEDGTITAAEQALAFELTDIAAESAQGVDLDGLARELANAAADKIETDICSAFTSFSTTKGTTGVAMSVATFEDGILALRQAKAPSVPQANSNLPADLAGYFSVMSESGVAQLATALRAAGTSVMSPSTTRMLETLGATAASAARFSYLGVNVFGQDLVATTGGDRNGAILCPAAIGLVMKRQPRVETQRHAIGTSTYAVGSVVYGAGIAKNVFGVEFLHLA